MELFTPEFWSALLAIVIIDLVLAGDNAIVIGMAARNLPKENQKKVIFWGTFGAIAIRSLLTLVVVWLLLIPGLRLTGGVLLVWIAYKLLVEEKSHEVKSAGSLWAAIKTIIIADTAMGLDNVLAIGGAAHGNFLLVIMGLLISIPIVVWGSTIILKLMERFPVIIYIGSGVLAFTAAKMIEEEPMLSGIFGEAGIVKWGFSLLVVVLVLLAGRIKNKSKTRAQMSAG
ncbi:TerC family protein [Paenibacillus sp. SYP-B4298]|uniref:TerC family protein n=1 Tax=Paenibacillus sp. SYP-B4298 TaxID=2996034 RepID=UPI0022DDDF03|nr:TerC family protein [Paenibacillus sp. SYP-B4298]